MRLPRFFSTWRRYRALTRHERRLSRAAWRRLLLVSVRLALTPRRALTEALAPSSRRRSPLPPSVPAAELVRAVQRAAAHHLRPMNCLPRALALAQALSEHGYDANVRIGVRRSDAGVAAHAWVELDGRPMGEPEAIASEFLPLLPPTSESSSASSPPSGRRTSAS